MTFHLSLIKTEVLAGRVKGDQYQSTSFSTLLRSVILVSEYPKRTFADEVISFTKIFLDAKPKYSWTSLEEYFQLKTKQLRSHLLLGFVCFKSQEQNFY